MKLVKLVFVVLDLAIVGEVSSVGVSLAFGVVCVVEVVQEVAALVLHHLQLSLSVHVLVAQDSFLRISFKLVYTLLGPVSNVVSDALLHNCAFDAGDLKQEAEKVVQGRLWVDDEILIPQVKGWHCRVHNLSIGNTCIVNTLSDGCHERVPPLGISLIEWLSQGERVT